MLQRFTYCSLITLLIFLSHSALKAQQITDRVTFPLNDYLYTSGGNPYPMVNETKLKSIDQSRFINVMNYGAKGDGKTLDDRAIQNAFNAANKASVHGVYFPSGKTFLVSQVSNITLTNDLTVYAYGATIKMKDLTRYSFLSLQYKSGSYHNQVIWLGGTFDGNQYNQVWPGNPHGGKYNGGFVEPHGRFIGVNWAEFAMFKDVTVLNTVVDGPTAESCKLAVFADSKASGGANFHYNTENGSKGVGEQGAYFKFTRVGMKTVYFLNLNCTGGSIGTFMSTPSNAPIDAQTLSVHVNCKIWNAAQDLVHIEDCYRNFFYNCDIGSANDGHFYIPRVHISNNTGVAIFKECVFTNAWLNYNQAAHLKLGIVDNCTFTAAGTKLNSFIVGNPHLSTHNTFSGSCSSQQAAVTNVRNCTFTNFGSLAVSGAYATDGSSFINGSTPVSTGRNGFVVNCTFKDVKTTSYKGSPSSSDWTKVFSSYEDVYSDANKYLGRIDCGTTTSRVQAVSNSPATALSASAARTFSGNIDYGFDSVQHQSVSLNPTANNSKAVGYQAEIIRLYPNPTTDVLHVSLNEKLSGKIALNIYDQQGRLVRAKAVDKNTAMLVETINVNNLTAGAYTLQIISEQQKSSVKFVVER